MRGRRRYGNVEPVVSLSSLRGDGDGWVDCADGQRRWGRFGAAGLLLRAPDAGGEPLLLLQHRAAWTHHGDLWGLPGGARNSDESAAATAVRESGEEAGIDPLDVRVVGSRRAHPAGDGWSYTTVVAEAAEPLTVTPNQESAELRWIPEPEVDDLALHPGFADSWRTLRTRPATVVVDGANVVGSVPDGWWRDRAGAAERLLRRLAAAPPRTLPLPDGTFGWALRYLVVLEGRASRAPDVAGVDVVRAPGSGDDTIAELACAEPGGFVVTADRGLRARLPAGVTALGPSTLLERLPA